MPNIPSVQSTVSDQTIVNQVTADGRSGLVHYFSKYGWESIVEFSEADYFTYFTGAENVPKYGTGSIFIRDPLKEGITKRMLGKRLLPTDAAYANVAITTNSEALAFEDLRNAKYLFEAKPFLEIMPLDTTSVEYTEYLAKKNEYEKDVIEKNSLVIGHIAKARGAGYNDIFISYSAALDYEKADSDINGEANYKFNFIKAEIFEKNKSGFRQLGDSFVFSLIDRDLETQELIKSTTTNQELFINNITKDSSLFADIFVNPEHLEELRKYRNIDDLMPDGRLIVPDLIEQDKYYEVTVETNDTVLGKPLSIVPVPTSSTPTMLPRIGYQSNIYPFTDTNRTQLKAELTGTVDSIGGKYDYINSNNTCLDTDTLSDRGFETSVSIRLAKNYKDEIVVFAELNRALSQDVDVPLNIKGTGPFNSSIDTVAPFISSVTIPAGEKVGEFNLDLYYGGLPISFDATIINADTDTNNDFPVGTFPKMTDGTEIGIRVEKLSGIDVLRNHVVLGNYEPLTPTIMLELNQDTNPSEPNHKMVVDVILEQPITEDTDVLIDYTVTIGGVDTTISLIITLEYKASESDKLVYNIDLYALSSTYALPIFMYRDIYVEDEQVKIGATVRFSDEPVPESFYVNGESAFYDISIDPQESTAFALTPHSSLRQRMYDKLVGSSIKLYNGYDGANLYDNKGNLNISGASVDGSENAATLMRKALEDNKELKTVLYPKYVFDYLPTWMETVEVINAGIELCDATEMVFGIHSIPTTYDINLVTEGFEDKDVYIRKNKIYKSTMNNILISSQKNMLHTDISDGSQYSMPASYYEFMNNLRIDKNISITEPVANIEKGVVENQTLNLQYAPDAYAIETLKNSQINSILVETDGTYFLTQMTMYKKVSKLNNANVVKTIQSLRKLLPTQLKPFLQLKSTGLVVEAAVRATKAVVDLYVITDNNSDNGLFEYATIVPYYNEQTQRLRLTLTVKPVGTIEQIEVPIVVV